MNIKEKLTVEEWRAAIARIPAVARDADEAEYLKRVFLALAEEQHPFDFGENIVRLPELANRIEEEIRRRLASGDGS